MSCGVENFLQYFSGDNQSIEIDVDQDDGSPIPNLEDDISDAKFQAFDSSGTKVINATMNGVNNVITYDHQGNIDKFTIQPTIEMMTLPAGDYSIFFKIELSNPQRSFHVKMKQNGIALTKLRILSGITSN